jgi:hypothetical protein
MPTCNHNRSDAQVVPLEIVTCMLAAIWIWISREIA